MRPFLKISENPLGSLISEATVDGVPLEKCLAVARSPVYLTSLSAVAERARIYRQSLSACFPNSKIHYAVKANFAQAVLQEVLGEGVGLDIVSPGELRAALRAQCNPALICYAGVGKRTKDIVEALDHQVQHLNAEHMDELLTLLELISKNKAKVGTGSTVSTEVSLRWNPCLDIQTHPHLRTGALDSKFGILSGEILKSLGQMKTEWGEEAFLKHTTPIRGIHVHVGSQLQNPEVYGALCLGLSGLAKDLFALGVQISHFDLGGGLGVGKNGVPADGSDIRSRVEFVCGHLKEALRNRMSEEPSLKGIWGSDLSRVSVALEPGRSIVASSTVFLTEVLYTKANSDAHRFVYVDAGMNDFPRPSLYGATHAHTCLFADERNKGKVIQKCSIVGPVCESADVLAREAQVPPLVAGDLVCFFEAGAYCRSMASHYNLRPLPAEIFLKNGQIVGWHKEIWPS